MHRAFDSWLVSHTNGRLTALPYAPKKYPHQRIDTVDVAPLEPSVEVAAGYGRATLGQVAYDGLVEALKEPPQNLINVMLGRVAVRQNVLVATAHARSVLDTALTHNAAFCAAEQAEFAPSNALITNKLMSRLAINDEPVTNILARSGRVFIGIPFSESAQSAGLSQSIVEHVNRPMGVKLLKLLKEGVVLHRALSDTVAKEKALPDGSASRVIPRISESMTHIVTKRLPYVLPIPMWLQDNPSENPNWQIMRPYGIIKPHDVHLMMDDLANKVSEMSEVPVVYDLPAGLQKKPAVVSRLAHDKA